MYRIQFSMSYLQLLNTAVNTADSQLLQAMKRASYFSNVEIGIEFI